MGSFGYADGAILAAPTVYAMKSVLKLCDHFGVISVKSIYVHPPGGWIYYFCFFRRPMSDVRRPASDVRRHAWFPLI